MASTDGEHGTADRMEIQGSGGLAPWAGASHPGTIRPSNEDYLLARPDLGLWVVCDGLGGHELGEEASMLAARAIARSVAAGRSLSRAMQEADQALIDIFGARDDLDPRRPPGATAVALCLAAHTWEVAWVGDCRAWVKDGTPLTQVTRDHTLVQQMVDQGELTETEARDHPMRSIIRQAIGLGGIRPLAPGTVGGRYTPGSTTILLATDGLLLSRTPEAADKIINNSASPQQAADRLIHATLAQGAPDNVTVLLAGWRK